MQHKCATDGGLSSVALAMLSEGPASVRLPSAWHTLALYVSMACRHTSIAGLAQQPCTPPLTCCEMPCCTCCPQWLLALDKAGLTVGSCSAFPERSGDPSLARAALADLDVRQGWQLLLFRPLPFERSGARTNRLVRARVGVHSEPCPRCPRGPRRQAGLAAAQRGRFIGRFFLNVARSV